MRTPKKYTDNLKAGIITEEMLADALHSVNKRAKNWRDKKREYRKYYTNKYSDSAEMQEGRMYAKKEILLSIVPVLCIHKEHGGCKRTRVYDYEKNYIQKYTNAFLRGSIVWENSYMDWDTYEEVSFFDVLDLLHPIYRYYLYRVVNGHGFHTPIDKEEAQKYDCPIVDIGYLLTDGEDSKGLLSVQFVDKVISLIESGEYEFVPSESAPTVQYKSEQTQEDEPCGLVDCEAFLGLFNDYGWRFKELAVAHIKASLGAASIALSEEDKANIRDWVLSVIPDSGESEKVQRKCIKNALRARFAKREYSLDPARIYGFLRENYSPAADLYSLIVEASIAEIREQAEGNIASDTVTELGRQYARETADAIFARRFPKKKKRKKKA